MKDSTLKGNYVLERVIARTATRMYANQIDEYKVNFAVLDIMNFTNKLSSMRSPQRDNKECKESSKAEPVIIL